MSEILTVEDLEAAKKHDLFHAEVITGRAGGVSTGAAIDHATNTATGQVQKTLPAILRDAPEYADVSGNYTFADGFTITKYNQVALYNSQWYKYHGPNMPLTVAPLSTPSSDWSPIGDTTTLGALALSDGASKIGYSSGTVASELLSLLNAINLKSNTSDVNAALAAKADTATLTNRTKKGGLTQSIAGNALTLTQAKRLFNFRSVTLTDGTAVEVTPPSDMTLTVPSGATLGLTSGVAGEILVILLYNGGTPVLGVANANGGLVLDESGLISTTAISASATSASAIYTTAAVTNSPYIILARLTVTLPSEGAWSVLPKVTPIDLIGVSMMSRRMVIPAIATTSGAAIDQAIPSWARRITILFNGVSTSGTSLPLLRFGTPTVAASGYYSTAFNSTSNAVNNVGNTTGFILVMSFYATTTLRGVITLLSPDGVTWTESGVTSDSAAVTSNMSSGSVTLSALATVLRLTTVNGTDTFDAGSISFLIEG